MGVLKRLKNLFKPDEVDNSAFRSGYKSKGLDVLDARIAYNKYGAYCIPSDSSLSPVLEHLQNTQVPYAQCIEYMKSCIQDGDIVLSGEYAWQFYPALETSMSDEAHIWAFQGTSEDYRHAYVTMFLNRLHQIHLFQLNLDNSHTEDDETTFDFKDSVSIGLADSLALDDILPSKRRISLIYLDLGNDEEAALRGAIKTMKRYKPVLLLKSTEHYRNWLQEELIANGYKEQKKFGDIRAFVFSK